MFQTHTNFLSHISQLVKYLTLIHVTEKLVSDTALGLLASTFGWDLASLPGEHIHSNRAPLSERNLRPYPKPPFQLMTLEWQVKCSFCPSFAVHVDILMCVSALTFYTLYILHAFHCSLWTLPL